KLRTQAQNLETEVRVLREQVQKLEFQLQMISPRIIENTTPWNVVAEYFRLFRFVLTASACVYETRMHRDLLRNTMAPGVIIDDDQGVETMLERWSARVDFAAEL
ncbi:hypothetical protein PHYSODRAFT_536156, partial [Phytophthora sojae]